MNQKYARPDDVTRIVIETFIPPNGFVIKECFPPGVVDKFLPCPDYVQPGWTYHPDADPDPEVGAMWTRL